jgi:hypothetical protein
MEKQTKQEQEVSPMSLGNKSELEGESINYTDSNYDNLSGIGVIKIIVLKIVSIIFSVTALVVFIISVGGVTGYFYDATHQIPDPVARGDDLGGGLVVVSLMFVAFVASIIIFLPLNRLVFKILNKILRLK